MRKMLLLFFEYLMYFRFLTAIFQVLVIFFTNLHSIELYFVYHMYLVGIMKQ